MEVKDSGRILRVALAVGGVSLLVRLIWAISAHVTQLSDFATYESLAVNWLANKRFGFDGCLATRAPGYPGFIALIYAVAGRSPRAVGLLQAPLGGLTSMLLVLIAARVVSLRAAALAGLVHAVCPSSIAYVPVLASENLAVPLVVASVLSLAVAGESRGRRRALAALAAGTLWGVGVVVRPAAVFMLPALVVLAMYNFPRRAWSAAAPVLLLLGGSLAVSPWLIRNCKLGLGPRLSTMGGPDLWMGNNDLASDGGYCPGAWNLEGLGEREQDAAYTRQAVDWIRTHPWRYTQLSWRRLRRLLGTSPDVWAAMYLTPTRRNNEATSAYFQAAEEGKKPSVSMQVRSEKVQGRNADWLRAWRVLLVPFMLIGLALSFRDWRRYSIVVWPALSYMFGVALTFAEPRFRALVEPLLFVPLAAFVLPIIECHGRGGAARPEAAPAVDSSAASDRQEDK